MDSAPGNLLFEPTPEALAEVKEVLAEIRLGKWLEPGEGERRKPAELLPLVIYSDFEVDDLMAIAQLWQWNLERRDLKGSRARPVIIFAADFAHKDGCGVFEKKLLMARLMLGLEPCRDFQVVCPENVTYYDKTVHPLANTVWNNKPDSLALIAEEIHRIAARGDKVDFYTIAPGRGQIADVLSTIETRYPDSFAALCQSTHVVMYTGSFNTSGCEPRDLEYLCKLSASQPLVDISKFVFFGRADADPVTASADSFAAETLAPALSKKSRLLAAAVVVFAEEFQGNLILPDKPFLFRGSTLTDEEQHRFKTTIAPLASVSLQKYSESLMNDAELFKKVAGYKQSTVKAFALGTCDAPLCDEVCFLFEWCLENRKDSMLDATGEGGKWWIDSTNGFSGIATESSPAPERARLLGVQALQPSMKEPKDQALLQKMREILEEYVIRHMDSFTENGS